MEEMYHIHQSHYEIGIILQGRFEYLFDYKEFTVSAYDIIFINKKTSHQSEALTKDTIRIIINFNDDFLTNIGAESINLSELFSSNIIKLSENKIPEITHLISKLVFENDYPSVFSEKLTQVYMYEFFVTLHRSLNMDTVTRTLPINPIIEMATKYICEHFSDELSLDSIAECCHVNKYHLSRLFKEIMGINLNSYINSIRIHHALDMLSNTDMTILEISQSCGYNSVKHFCEVFKKQQGITAREFRKKNYQRTCLH